MLNQVISWYVFNVFKKVNHAIHIAIFLLAFILAVSLDGVLKGFKIDWSSAIWLSALVIDMIILFHAGLCMYLEKNLHIHSDSGDDEWRRFFLGLDEKTGKQVYFKEADLMIRTGLDCIHIELVSPSFSDDDVPNMDGIIEKNVETLEVRFPSIDSAISLDIILLLYDQHDVGEIVQFVSRQYYDTAAELSGYEDYLERLLFAMSVNWVEMAQKKYFDKHDDCFGTETNELILHEMMTEYMCILKKDFHPLLLPNVKAVDVRLSGGRDFEKNVDLALEKEKIKIVDDNRLN